jgi:hypothetical protein
MEKISLKSSINYSNWGKALLAAGLLLVAAAGVLQLQEVQAVFFPGRRHAIELKVIRHECAMIDKGFIALRADVTKLQGLCAKTSQSEPGAPSPSPQPAARVQPDTEPAWPITLHTAKKDRVYIARKLKYIDIMLKSMQQAVERQQASYAGTLVHSKPEMEKTLGQIQEIRARCQIYANELRSLSERLNQLAGCSGRR